MSALSSKVVDGELSVIESVVLAQPKTKEMVKIQKMAGNRKTLIVTTEVTEALTLASRNLSDLTVIAAHHLNLGDLLRAQVVLITPEAAEKIQAIWGPKLAKRRLETRHPERSEGSRTKSVGKRDSSSLPQAETLNDEKETV